MRAIFAPMQDTKAITLLALFGVGSRYEKAKTLGISHFLEHMMFKGTKKRPKAIEISKILDGVGAEYNAFTSKDFTGYYIKVNYEKIELAMELMSDMLANSILAEEEVERERKVIQEEINMYEDNPMMLVEELYEEELYRGSTLGWRIAGDAKSLANIRRVEIAGFRREHYRPKNTVFVASGRFQDDIEKMVEKYFGKLKGDGHSGSYKNFVSEKRHTSGPRLVVRFRDTGQVQLALGFPAYGSSDKRLATLKILAIILGGSMSSRLFIAVRERRGLAYFVRASLNIYQDVGNLYIQAGLDKNRIDAAIKTIVKELERIAKNGVTTQELIRAKENVRGHMALSLEESSDVADFLGRQELLLGEIKTPEQKLEEIFKVTREDVLKAARDIFKSEKMAAAIIGPFKEAERFKKILKF